MTPPSYDDSGTTIAMPLLKIATAWLAALGLTSWGDVASAMAALYTFLLIVEWVAKKLRGRRK